MAGLDYDPFPYSQPGSGTEKTEGGMWGLVFWTEWKKDRADGKDHPQSPFSSQHRPAEHYPKRLGLGSRSSLSMWSPGIRGFRDRWAARGTEGWWGIRTKWTLTRVHSGRGRWERRIRLQGGSRAPSSQGGRCQWTGLEVSDTQVERESRDGARDPPASFQTG